MKKIFTLLMMFCSMNLFSQTIYYVKTTGNDADDGTSWATAFRTVQKALGTITTGQIWVATGTFYPDEIGSTNSNDRYASFFLKHDVALYGGFAGDEVQLSERHPATNNTILSGEIQQDGSMDNNSLHVVRSANVNATAVLDGFTITHGNANSSGENDEGAGMYNYWSSPTISNCLFARNSATMMGGGIKNLQAFPTLTNCIFWGNTASSYDNYYHTWNGWGSAIDNRSSGPRLINCTFARNEAAASGGYAINSLLSSMSMVNCILWDNGKEIENTGGSMTVSFSLVKGGFPGTGNTSSDPLFADAVAGNLRLQGCSPAIDAGRIIDVPQTVTTDADGNPRYVAGEVDMGAYEYQQGGTPTFIFVDRTVSGGLHDGTSWANAFNNIPEAVQKAATCKNTEIWVTADTYYPTENSTGRTASFILKNNVTLRGGFEGTEVPGDPHVRRYYLTTLSGDIDGDGTSAGNAYHVVQATDVDNAILDGFIITGGNADSSFNDSQDRGGGIYSERSSITVSNCIFKENYALNYGGGAFNGNMKYTAFINCVFTKNTSDYAGAAIYNIASSPRIINCSIGANSAAATGGGVYNISSSFPTITNSILWGNSNSITNVLGANSVVTYSLVEGGYTGSGNLAVDPLFSDTASGNLHLLDYSPAIDTGDNAAVPATVTTDLDGYPRFNGRVDMGAFEWYPVSTGGGGGPRPHRPLTITCSGDFTVYADSEKCGTTVDYFDSHPAMVMGGKNPVTVIYTPPSPSFLSIGANTITVTATDSTGDTKTCSFVVTVVDTIPPVIMGVTATPSVLYPPNHKMQDLTVAYNLTDNCPGVTTTLSVTSNEPQYGTGSGDTGPDWQMIDEHHIRLRAERSGNGIGRIYTITITATDATGNTATATTTVSVPHDNGAAVTTTQRRIGNEELITGLKVQAIPNPTTDGFTVITQSSSAQTLTIRVTDNLGRVVERRTGVTANGTVYLGRQYLPGMYFMEFVQGDKVQTLKLLKKVR